MRWRAPLDKLAPMVSPPKRAHHRLLLLILLLAAGALWLVAALFARAPSGEGDAAGGARGRKGELGAATELSLGEEGRWVALKSPLLSKSAAMALAPEALLVLGEGENAPSALPMLYDARGEARAIEAPMALTRLFEADGRLFAAGKHEGRPLLIALPDPNKAPEEGAQVSLLPCMPSALAGRGQLYLIGCEGEGEGAPRLALSRDGGKRFVLIEMRRPALQGVPASARVRVEGVSVGADGALAVALALCWREPGQAGEQGEEGPAAQLEWCLAVAGVGSGARLSYEPLPGLSSIAALLPAGAGFLALGWEGDGRLGLWRLREEGVGREGDRSPPCDAPGSAYLLGAREVAALCGGELLLSLDGGLVWSRHAAPGRITRLFGGSLRLVALTEQGPFEGRFLGRSVSGAVSRQLPAGAPSAPTTPPAILPAGKGAGEGVGEAAASSAGGRAPSLPISIEVREPEP